MTLECTCSWLSVSIRPQGSSIPMVVCQGMPASDETLAGLAFDDLRVLVSLTYWRTRRPSTEACPASALHLHAQIWQKRPAKPPTCLHMLTSANPPSCCAFSLATIHSQGICTYIRARAHFGAQARPGIGAAEHRPGREVGCCAQLPGTSRDSHTAAPPQQGLSLPGSSQSPSLSRVGTKCIPGDHPLFSALVQSQGSLERLRS